MAEQRSIYGELQSTGDYLTMDDEQLLERSLYYAKLYQSPELSPRAKEDVDRIIGRLVFEVTMRQRDHE